MPHENHFSPELERLVRAAVRDEVSRLLPAEIGVEMKDKEPVFESLEQTAARLCADLFGCAGSHVSFPVPNASMAALGDSSKAGLLMAALDLRDVLMQFKSGREALRGLGFGEGAQNSTTERIHGVDDMDWLCALKKAGVPKHISDLIPPRKEWGVT